MAESNTTDALIKWENLSTDMQTGRKPCEDEDRKQDDMCTRCGTPRVARQPPTRS